MKNKLAEKIILAITQDLAIQLDHIAKEQERQLPTQDIILKFVLPRAIELAIAKDTSTRTCIKILRNRKLTVDSEVLAHVKLHLASLCSSEVMHTTDLTPYDKCVLISSTPCSGAAIILDFDVAKLPKFRKWFNANNTGVFLSRQRNLAYFLAETHVQYKIDLAKLTNLLEAYYAETN